MDWAQILVILLSVILAVFLLLAIVLIVLLIKVTHQIKSVTSSAQRAAEHMESAVAGLGKSVSPMFVMGIIKKFMRKSKK